MAGIPGLYEEVVNGIVIGPFTNRYGFFRDNRRLFEFKHFENDTQAIAWAKENYPEEFKTGMEMRCYE